MRRTLALPLAVAFMMAAGPVAAADPVGASVETGAELDDNVQRVYQPNGSTPPIGAAALRAGARLDLRGRAHGGYVVSGQFLSRLVIGGDAPDESIGIGTVDGRWATPLGKRPVSVGVRGTASDVVALAGIAAARGYRTVGGAGVMDVVDGDTHVSAWLGGRSFTYKPDDALSWRGATLGAHLETTLWSGGAEDERTLDLDVDAAFDDRRFDSLALRDRCGSGARDDSACLVPSSALRSDRFHRVAVDLTYTGDTVASLGYQLIAIDSTSFGQSLVRHRLAVSATHRLPLRIYGSALVTAQLDQYPDGLLVQDDPMAMTTATLDDENRSSVQVRLARPIDAAWSVEIRLATWRDLGQTEPFERSLVYVGLTWARAGASE